MRRNAIVTATLAALLLLVVMIWSGYWIHLRLGIEDLSAWGAYFSGIGTVLLGLVAVSAAIQGLKEYNRRTSTERMRWLEEFYERFYENKRFRMIRQRIDFDDFKEILALIRRDSLSDASFDQEEKNLFDDFTDYLNFFEMLLYLGKKDQILKDECESMFGYYLRRIRDVTGASEVLDYLRKAKFKNLHQFLVE